MRPRRMPLPPILGLGIYYTHPTCTLHQLRQGSLLAGHQGSPLCLTLSWRVRRRARSLLERPVALHRRISVDVPIPRKVRITLRGAGVAQAAGLSFASLGAQRKLPERS